MKTIKAWAGFCDDKLDIGVVDEIWRCPSFSIFKTKREAKHCYEDVRKVEIRVCD